MAQLYIALPLASINTLAFISLPQPYSVPSVVYVPMLVLSVFIFLWCNDAGAYCVGSLIGKHKLFPRISPAKSWEGSIGGGIIAILASQAIAYFAKELLGPCPLTNPLAWAGLAIVVVVFGTWGDLVESLLKRKLGIKDSGNILPGHGGMLDRFDSSLLAFPAAVDYIYTITLYI
jgi:phosphatidate cytidylyltransferase